VKHPLIDHKHGVIRVDWNNAFNYINFVIPKWDAKKGYYIETPKGVQIKVCVR
jgi:hypothetical protein